MIFVEFLHCLGTVALMAAELPACRKPVPFISIDSFLGGRKTETG